MRYSGFLGAATALSAALVSGCEDVYSLTPNTVLASFTSQAGIRETDAVLKRLAQRRDLSVNREPEPQERAIPRDYLATVIRDDCMLLVEGHGWKAAPTIKVTLQAPPHSICDREMQTLFAELRRGLP